MPTPLKPGLDYYWENGRMVLTAAFLLRRGTCCGTGCRHCPYGTPPRPTEPDPEEKLASDGA